MKQSHDLLDVKVDEREGLVVLAIDAEKHGWSIRTQVENSPGYHGDEVESVNASATCMIQNPEDLERLGDLFTKRADELRQHQAREQ